MVRVGVGGGEFAFSGDRVPVQEGEFKRWVMLRGAKQCGRT